MSRQWEPGRGWVVDRAERTCRTCGGPVPERVGRGRAFTYCETHAPANRGYIASYQREHADQIRERQRERSGYRPTRSFDCADCGRPTRSYLDTNLCHTCRQRAAHGSEMT